MTKEELITQIERFFTLKESGNEAYMEVYREELNRLYFHVTGEIVTCKPCRTDQRRLSLRNWLANPKKVYELQPINYTIMAKNNVSEKYALKDPSQTITFSTKNGFVAITKDNLTDDLAELALKNEKVAHNIITLKPAAEPAADTKKAPTAAK